VVTACATGNHAIGDACKLIQRGIADVMIAGGAEAIIVPLTIAGFCAMKAMSTRNDEPEKASRPFEAHRDGFVCGEGGGVLVLEALEHARARDARIRGEILGFATNCDGYHITNPDVAGMERVMALALEDAGLPAERVGYVNAHGTATRLGDVAESHATHRVFGGRVPVSSLKGFMGHTLGACGALEAWLTLAMMQEGWLAPTLNLDVLDPECAPLDYVMGAPRAVEIDLAVSNNFAFGGVNTSLVLGRWREEA
jgi:3-oxoacyl-[acyl-carrier-protein] synthase II